MSGLGCDKSVASSRVSLKAVSDANDRLGALLCVVEYMELSSCRIWAQEGKNR